MGGGQLLGPDAEVGGVEADAVEALGGVEDGRVAAGADVLEEGLDRALEGRLEDRGGGAGEEAGLLGGVEVGPAADGEDRHGAASVADRRGGDPGVPRRSHRAPLCVALARQPAVAAAHSRMTTTPGAHDAPPLPGARPVRAPRGTEISCRGWQQEAALRMLMNNLDPEVAENPDDLVVYGGTGRAARSWEAFDAIVRELRALADDETLLVQSGKPVGVFRTHPWAPRVLIANSNLVGKWATWEHFRELERAGLMMYGQMTAGSWIYIGTQGILQGTYETFAELARQHFGGTLRGRVVAHRRPRRDGRRPAAGRHDERRRGHRDRGRRGAGAPAPRDRLRRPARPIRRMRRSRWPASRPRRGEPLSIALVGNAAEIEPAWAKRGERFDAVTDQTSAHDALNGYVPAGMTLADALALRPRPSRRSTSAGRIASMADHVRAMLAFQEPRRGRLRLRQQHPRPGPAGGRRERLRLRGLRPRSSSGPCSARAGARSAGPRSRATRPTSCARTRRPARSSRTTPALRRWIEMAQAKVPFQGLPARICWLGYGERAKAGLAFNELVRRGRGEGARSSSAATTSTPAPSPRPTARRRR